MRVAIVITCYNLGAYLAEALASAQATAYPHLDIVVVDDGSTDPDTRAEWTRLERINAGDPRVRFLRQSNSGLPAARNTAIRATQAEILLPLDADNRLRPEYAARAVEVFAAHPDVGVVCAQAWRFGDAEGPWEWPVEIRVGRMLSDNEVEACSAFRRAVWEQAGGYDELRFREGLEDWDFWLSALERGWEFHRLPEVLFEYRVRRESLARSTLEPERNERLIRALAEKHRALYEAHWLEAWLAAGRTKLDRHLVINGLLEETRQKERDLADLRRRLAAAERGPSVLNRFRKARRIPPAARGPDGKEPRV
jgi:glycosyltransferase involved in cell wall biosynthesis